MIFKKIFERFDAIDASIEELKQIREENETLQRANARLEGQIAALEEDKASLEKRIEDMKKSESVDFLGWGFDDRLDSGVLSDD